MTTVEVISQTQIIDAPIVVQEISVDPITSEVTFVVTNETPVAVINAGPQGPQGVVGPAGPSNPTMNFVQASPSTEWTINHNFGFYPSISIFTVGGIEMMGEVLNTTINQTLIRFNTSVAGSARLS